MCVSPSRGPGAGGAALAGDNRGRTMAYALDLEG